MFVAKGRIAFLVEMLCSFCCSVKRPHGIEVTCHNHVECTLILKTGVSFGASYGLDRCLFS